eukprot:TRINITY_DN48572_c0_g1_i1.p1 TRINITY_DN48572_c0_g1~~TRINITY_DN48572_c0_g1_i1.p1  ORF type:complete len:306 (+),score=39.99 TRINITY_DN48572_c0_g1_i1:78-995(+)
MADATECRVAFGGNSLIYFNDLPRLFEAIAGESRKILHDCCLRGGANLTSLFEKGNGMSEKFNTTNALLAQVEEGSEPRFDIGSPTISALLEDARGWDFLVMNDYTQGPARVEAGTAGPNATRGASVEVLRTKYAPLLVASRARPVLVQTWAYREHTKGSEDLGDHVEFDRRLAEGTEVCASALDAAMEEISGSNSTRTLIVPMGSAFAAVRSERLELWRDLFNSDGFHPSPLGSYLFACTLYVTLFGELPPAASSLPLEPASLWEKARVMQPRDTAAERLPTVDECAYLRDVADRTAKCQAARL